MVAFGAMSNIPPVAPMPVSGAWQPKSLVPPILITICCCLVGGIVAIVFTAQANTAGASGNIALAEQKARTAKTWMIVSVVIGVISAIVGGVLSALGQLAQTAQH